MFTRPAGGSWRALDIGLPETAATRAETGLPAAVITVWRWQPHTCHPPNL